MAVNRIVAKSSRWEVASVPDGLDGGTAAGAAARAALDVLLDGGWEPFAVDRGRIWLRRQPYVEA